MFHVIEEIGVEEYRLAKSCPDRDSAVNFANQILLEKSDIICAHILTDAEVGMAVDESCDKSI